MRFSIVSVKTVMYDVRSPRWVCCVSSVPMMYSVCIVVNRSMVDVFSVSLPYGILCLCGLILFVSMYVPPSVIRSSIQWVSVDSVRGVMYGFLVIFVGWIGFWSRREVSVPPIVPRSITPGSEWRRFRLYI